MSSQQAISQQNLILPILVNTTLPIPVTVQDNPLGQPESQNVDMSQRSQSDIEPLLDINGPSSSPSQPIQQNLIVEDLSPSLVKIEDKDNQKVTLILSPEELKAIEVQKAIEKEKKAIEKIENLKKMKPFFEDFYKAEDFFTDIVPQKEKIESKIKVVSNRSWYIEGDYIFTIEPKDWEKEKDYYDSKQTQHSLKRFFTSDIPFSDKTTKNNLVRTRYLHIKMNNIAPFESNYFLKIYTLTEMQLVLSYNLPISHLDPDFLLQVCDNKYLAIICNDFFYHVEYSNLLKFCFKLKNTETVMLRLVKLKDDAYYKHGKILNVILFDEQYKIFFKKGFINNAISNYDIEVYPYTKGIYKMGISGMYIQSFHTVIILANEGQKQEGMLFHSGDQCLIKMVINEEDRYISNKTFKSFKYETASQYDLSDHYELGLKHQWIQGKIHSQLKAQNTGYNYFKTILKINKEFSWNFVINQSQFEIRKHRLINDQMLNPLNYVTVFSVIFNEDILEIVPMRILLSEANNYFLAIDKDLKGVIFDLRSQVLIQHDQLRLICQPLRMSEDQIVLVQLGNNQVMINKYLIQNNTLVWLKVKEIGSQDFIIFDLDHFAFIGSFSLNKQLFQMNYIFFCIQMDSQKKIIMEIDYPLLIRQIQKMSESEIFNYKQGLQSSFILSCIDYSDLVFEEFYKRLFQINPDNIPQICAPHMDNENIDLSFFNILDISVNKHLYRKIAMILNMILKFNNNFLYNNCIDKHIGFLLKKKVNLREYFESKLAYPKITSLNYPQYSKDPSVIYQSIIHKSFTYHSLWNDYKNYLGHNVNEDNDQPQNLEYFETEFIQSILNFKWNTYTSKFFMNQFYLYLAFLISYVTDLYFFTINAGAADEEDSRSIVQQLVLKLTCVGYLLLQEYYEIRMLKRIGFVEYATDLWNIIDQAMALLYFVFVSMLKAVFMDLRYFIMLYVFVLIVYGLIFTLLKIKTSPDNIEYEGINYFGYFIMAFRASTGDFQIDNFYELEDAHIIFAWIVWISAVLFLNIILLNFIIAVISESYEKVMQKMVAESYRVKAELIKERESYFSDEELNNEKYFPSYIIYRRPVEDQIDDNQEWQGFVKDLKKSIFKTQTEIIKAEKETLQYVKTVEMTVKDLQTTVDEMKSSLETKLAE
eukprot:403339764